MTPIRDAFRAAVAAHALAATWHESVSEDWSDYSPGEEPVLVEQALSLSEALVEALDRATDRARAALLETDEPCTYTFRDDGGSETEIEATSTQDAVRQAREWALGGDWDQSDTTFWVDVRVTGEAGDEERVTVAIDPPEPECSAEEGHDWQSPHEVVGGVTENPGVWGHGGGVIITECCMRCGCRRDTDTWAQRPDTGEQGLQSVRYEEAAFADKLKVA